MKKTNIQRRIDRVLSKSIFIQACVWFVFVGVVFSALLLLKWIFNIEISYGNWALHFLNPANYFPESITSAHKWWALITGFLGMVFLSGLLIPIINNAIVRRMERIQNGQVLYHFDNHYVIIGSDGMTASIIKQICKESGREEIVILTAKNVRDVRHQLEVDLNKEEMRRVFFIQGASNSDEDLRKLYIWNALRLIILGDDDSEAHDVLNMQCFWQIYGLLKNRESKKLECDLLFHNQSTYVLLQKIGTVDNEKLRNKIHFRPFNFHETWAQKVIVDNKAEINNTIVNYKPLDREGISYDSDKSVHFVIMGMNYMGVALAVETARTAHFPNFIRDPKKKTRITLIDSNAEQQMNFILSRYPHLFELIDFDYTDVTQKSPEYRTMEQYKNPNVAFNDFLDIHFSFIKGNFESPQIRKLLSDWAQEEDKLLTIAVCIDDTTISTAAGIYLPPIIYSKNIPVFIQQKETSGLFTERVPQEVTGNQYKNVRPFGMINECFSMKIREIEEMAMKVMWIYNTYYTCRREPESDIKKILQTMKKTETTIDLKKLEEEWQKDKLSNRWSNIYNAYTIHIKERSHGFSSKKMNDDDIRLLAKVEHNRWNVERLIFGFRATTKEENTEIRANPARKGYYKAEKFAHYDIRPFDELDFDADGVIASEYDICLSECLPKIIEKQTHNKNE